MLSAFAAVVCLKHRTFGQSTDVPVTLDKQQQVPIPAVNPAMPDSSKSPGIQKLRKLNPGIQERRSPSKNQESKTSVSQ